MYKMFTCHHPDPQGTPDTCRWERRPVPLSSPCAVAAPHELFAVRSPR